MSCIFYNPKYFSQLSSQVLNELFLSPAISDISCQKNISVYSQTADQTGVAYKNLCTHEYLVIKPTRNMETLDAVQFWVV